MAQCVGCFSFVSYSGGNHNTSLLNLLYLLSFYIVDSSLFDWSLEVILFIQNLKNTKQVKH